MVDFEEEEDKYHRPRWCPNGLNRSQKHRVQWLRSLEEAEARYLETLRKCCRSKPTGEQRQATRGAGRLPGLLVGPGPSVNGPEVRHTPWLGEVLGVPPDLYLISNV
jgi:hypothetical protein